MKSEEPGSVKPTFCATLYVSGLSCSQRRSTSGFWSCSWASQKAAQSTASTARHPTVEGGASTRMRSTSFTVNSAMKPTAFSAGYISDIHNIDWPRLFLLFGNVWSTEHKGSCVCLQAIHSGMNCKDYQDDLRIRAENDQAAQQTKQMVEVSGHRKHRLISWEPSHKLTNRWPQVS